MTENAKRFEAEFRAEFKALMQTYNCVFTIETEDSVMPYRGSTPSINIEIHRDNKADCGGFGDYANVNIGAYFDKDS